MSKAAVKTSRKKSSPKKPSLVKTIMAKVDEELADIEQKLASGEMSLEGEQEAEKKVDDLIAKLERLDGLKARVQALKYANR